uniref:GRIP domain-containing protein n=1 Tax=Plectus sambesii TaxID=2011161 RepID=A0A914VWM2_9BILA
MSTWLRNLQGQLTELASEVLNEATEEVADPDTELQIVKKQASELEARLSASTREIERLQAACKESEEQAEASQLQNETLSDRYRGLLEAREADIRNLQTQLQQLQISADDGGHSSFHHSFTSSSPPLSPNAQDIQLQQSRDEVKQLKAEVAHWKNVVKQSEGGDAQHEVVNLRQELSSMTDKHQAEIASLQHAHFENVRSLRTQYEMRIASLQQSATASDIGSKPPTHGDDGWNTSWDEEDNWKGTGSMSEYSAPSLEDAASQKTATSDLVAQLEDMQRKYEQLQVDKAGLMEETARLVDSVQRERHQNLAASSEVDSLKYEAAERELDDARNKIVELELQVSSLQQNLETLDGQHEENLSGHLEQLKSAYAESEANREQMDRQMRDVSTTLSRREDELRAVEERLAEAQAKPSASASKGARQAADQEVLRNLFLSYFTAPNDKKREVAHLLASVLGFSAEEIKKMDGGAVSGWLGFLRGGGGNTPDTSITEQFIKFLETESTVAANAGKAHALPTDRASSVPVGGPSSGRSTPAFAFGHQRPPSIGQASLLTGPMDMPALNSPLRPPVDRTSDALKEMLQD